MKKLNIIITCFIISFSSVWANERIKTPEVLIESLAVYKESGAKSFVERFVKGSMLENEPSKISKIESSFLAYATQLGDFHDYEIIMNQQVTSKVTRTFLAIHYDIGVLFCRIDCYIQPDGESVILTGKWDSNSWDIFPWNAVQDEDSNKSE
ncbi:MAG: hypothetical protein ACSHX8_13925 [Opitutaceae bacterium]